jgi:very-short-patch-repair endonuclease
MTSPCTFIPDLSPVFPLKGRERLDLGEIVLKKWNIMAFIGKTRDPIMYFGANLETQELAKFLRMKMTPSEKLLWERLRRKNIMGFNFRRQHPIFRFIADFYCHELRLVIEADGPIHQVKDRLEKDLNRTAEFNRFGIKVLRFTNQEIKYNMAEVMKKISEEVKVRIAYQKTL